MCCVHKEQSYMSVFLIHWPYILSLFFMAHALCECVYFCPPWRSCIFRGPGSSLCQAVLLYFQWPLCPSHTALLSGPSETRICA